MRKLVEQGEVVPVPAELREAAEPEGLLLPGVAVMPESVAGSAAAAPIFRAVHPGVALVLEQETSVPVRRIQAAALAGPPE